MNPDKIQCQCSKCREKTFCEIIYGSSPTEGEILIVRCVVCGNIVVSISEEIFGLLASRYYYRV